jgi:hypothetical protein
MLRQDFDERVAMHQFGTFLCCEREVKRAMREEQGAAQRHRGRGATFPQVRSAVMIFIDSLLNLEDDHCSGNGIADTFFFLF